MPSTASKRITSELVIKAESKQTTHASTSTATLTKASHAWHDCVVELAKKAPLELHELTQDLAPVTGLTWRKLLAGQLVQDVLEPLHVAHEASQRRQMAEVLA
jgi:hypothetical protein